MRAAQTTKVACPATAAAILAALAWAGPAGAKAADCQPFAKKPCLLPFEDVRDTNAARRQKSDFLAPGGSVIDVCGGKPCHTDAYTP